MGNGIGQVNSPCGISVRERSKIPDPVRKLGIISRSQDDGRSTVFMNRPRKNVKIYIIHFKLYLIKCRVNRGFFIILRETSLGLQKAIPLRMAV